MPEVCKVAQELLPNGQSEVVATGFLNKNGNKLMKI